MTYEESQYETPPTVAALDAIGKKGHIVLLEGIKTGTAKVLIHNNIFYLQLYRKDRIFYSILGFCETALSRIQACTTNRS